jgi:hypothetical protein
LTGTLGASMADQQTRRMHTGTTRKGAVLARRLGRAPLANRVGSQGPTDSKAPVSGVASGPRIHDGRLIGARWTSPRAATVW